MIWRSLSTSLVHDASHGRHWRAFATRAFGGDLGRHRTLVLLNLTDGQLTRHVTADAMIPLALSVVEMITGSRSETPPLFTNTAPTSAEAHGRANLGRRHRPTGSVAARS